MNRELITSMQTTYIGCALTLIICWYNRRKIHCSLLLFNVRRELTRQNEAWQGIAAVCTCRFWTNWSVVGVHDLYVEDLRFRPFTLLLVQKISLLGMSLAQNLAELLLEYIMGSSIFTIPSAQCERVHHHFRTVELDETLWIESSLSGKHHGETNSQPLASQPDTITSLSAADCH